MDSTLDPTVSEPVQKKKGISDALKTGIGFSVSLPAMYLIGPFALFLKGFGIWYFPWLLGILLGMTLLPQQEGSLIATEFDGPIIVFAILASLQNAVMIWLILKRKSSSKVLRIVGIAFVLFLLVSIALALLSKLTGSIDPFI